MQETQRHEGAPRPPQKCGDVAGHRTKGDNIEMRSTRGEDGVVAEKDYQRQKREE